MKKPEIYCAIYFEQGRNFDCNSFDCAYLDKYTNLSYTKIENGIQIKTKYIKCTELSKALNLLFEPIKEIEDSLRKYDFKVWLDICIVHYEFYPTMILEGETMELIKRLNMEISFDIY